MHEAVDSSPTSTKSEDVGGGGERNERAYGHAHSFSNEPLTLTFALSPTLEPTQDTSAVQTATQTADVLFSDDGTGLSVQNPMHTLAALQVAGKVDENGQLRKDAFSDDATLINVVLPEGVTSMEVGYHIRSGQVLCVQRAAFSGCKSLREIDLPSTLTVISAYAFEGCSSLIKVALADTLTVIGAEAFAGCSSLREIILPDALSALSANAFEGCSSLTEIVLPDTLTVISDHTFNGCISLRKIILPATLLAIEGESAFNGCTSLSEVVFPPSLMFMATETFDGCLNLLTEIPAMPTFIAPTMAELHAAGKVDEADKLCTDAFSDNKTLTKVVLPDGVVGIGDDAFSGCSSLASITLPESLTSIGMNAFWGCASLQKVTFSNLLTHIGEFSFSGCISLTKVAFPDAIAVIGRGAFTCCSSLTAIALPDTKIVIGTGAFERCSSLTTLFITAATTRPTDTKRFLNHELNPPLYSTETRPLWSTLLITHFKWGGHIKGKHRVSIERVCAPDAILTVLGGPFKGYARYDDLPPALRAGAPHIQSWAGVELWRWWTPPDVAGDVGNVAQFRLLSVQYRVMVWTILLVCERHAASFGGWGEKIEDGRIVALAPYGAVPVELWMLIFGFYRRDAPVTSPYPEEMEQLFELVTHSDGLRGMCGEYIRPSVTEALLYGARFIAAWILPSPFGFGVLW
jgi:hypothetical protein